MITIFFDYLCPFAWRGLELAATLFPNELRLKHFSLEQGNHPDNASRPRYDPSWKLWEQPLEATRGLGAFLASHAAAAQGPEAQLRFALELFRIRHRERQELIRPVFEEAARRARLDLSRFQRDLEDEAQRRAELASNLQEAGQLAVFGTPTFVLPEGDAAYFRFTQLITDPQEALELWSLYTSVLRSKARIETIKRPRP